MSGTRETLDSKVTVDDDDTLTATSSKQGAQNSADEQRFWRALKPPVPAPSEASSATGEPDSVNPVDLAGDMQELSDHERESRRLALRSMLAASEARQQGSMRSRRPTLAIGERLQICGGVYKDVQGIVLDADFIHSRVYLQLDGVKEAQWIEFSQIAATLPS